MAVIWFIVAAIFFVLYLRKDINGPSDNRGDYQQGYWDGYRAFGDKVQGLLERGGDVTDDLQQYITDGNDGSFSSRTNGQPTETLATADTIDNSISMPIKTVADKRRTALRNLNTLLYFASFLLVAAAATFIMTAMPEVVRLTGLIVIVILFYGAGMILYQKVTRLRPAATAFVGTGLAILPFVGVAIHTLGGASAPISWFTISAIGLVLYYAAAIVLRSQVVSYLTMAFVLSLVSAGVSTAALPMIWYFIALIIVSLGASSVSILFPHAVPAIFREPVERTGQVVTPFVLVASLAVSDRIGVHAYEVIFGLATAHYLVAWLQTRNFTYETAVRILSQLTLGIVAWDFAHGQFASFGMMLVAIALAQSLYSLTRVQLVSKFSIKVETIWIAIMLAGMQCVQLLWLGSNHAGVWTSITLAVTTAIGVLALYRMHEMRWGYVAVAASVLLLPIFGRTALHPMLGWGVIALLFGLVAGATLVVLRDRWRRQSSHPMILLGIIASSAYMAMVVFSGAMSGDAITMAWCFMAVTVGVVVLSYSIDNAYVEIIATVPFVAMIASFMSQSTIQVEWYGTSIFVTSSALFVVAGALYHQLGYRFRRNTMLYAALVAFGCLLLVSIGAAHVVKETIFGLLVAGSLGLIGARAKLRLGTTAASVATTAYIAYALSAWLISFDLGLLLAALAYGLLIIVFWLVSYLEKIPAVMVLGNASVVAAVYCLWSGLELSSSWMVFGTGWISAAVLYGVYWLLFERKSVSRQLYQIISVGIVLAGVVLATVYAPDIPHQVAWSLTVLAGAIVAGLYGYVNKYATVVEAAIYIAVFGLQRLVAAVVLVDNFVFYAYWWAIVIAFVAWWRGGAPARTARLAISAGFITASVGLYALFVGEWYQLFFLIQSLTLLVIGAFASLRWLLWWGLVASSIAVLYFLRDYTFLWLGFLGLLLIGVVVWRLLRQRDRE